MSASKFKGLATGGLALAIGGATAVLAHPPLPSGRAGECFTEVVHPPAYHIVTETVPGAPVVSYRDIPAVFGHGTKQVVIVPARVERETIPAAYKTVPRWSMIPGRTTLKREPAVYRVVTERRLISPEHLEWRAGVSARGFSPSQAAGGYSVSVRPTGEVQCRVLVPARYALVSRRVMVSPGRVHRISGPPRKVICYVRVIATPARTVEHRIPAQYRTVQTTYIVTPAHRERTVTRGPDRNVSRRVISTPTQKTWAPIHCVDVRRLGERVVAPMTPQQSQGRAYPPNEILAPAPSKPQARGPERMVPPRPPRQGFDLPPLTPAPYDTGHPAPGR